MKSNKNALVVVRCKVFCGEDQVGWKCCARLMPVKHGDTAVPP